MPAEKQFNIRKFEGKDRQQVREISHDTALMGRPASLFFEGKDTVCDALTMYFTDYEPESCFVAESSSCLAGYLTGTRNKILSERVFSGKIMPGLLWRAVLKGELARRKNAAFLWRCVQAFLLGGLNSPDFTREYPAALHINIREEFRGMGVGGSLMTSYLEYLGQNRVCGVHLATMSDAAAGFFLQHSFKLLYKGKRSYFRGILHKDAPLYIFGRKIGVSGAG
ncbi:MAG: hypothetical protein WC572_02935 [Candidatus Omnitrophota bacterium]